MRAGTNLPRVKEYNQTIVLDIVRREGAVSRREISEDSGLTFQTVSDIAQRLLESGLVVEESARSPRGGRQSRVLKLNPNAAYAVGVQFTRSELSVALVDLEAKVLAQDRADIPRIDGPESVLPLVKQLADSVISGAGLTSDKVLGVGVGAVGPLGIEGGNVLLAPPKFAGWHDFPLKDELESHLGLPVMVENNVTAAAMGERWNGLGKSVADFVYLYFGRGIGAGIFVEDQLRSGRHGNSGEIAHVQVEPDGPPCYCGNSGCLEVYATPQGILREARQALFADSHLKPEEDVVLPRTVEEVVGSTDPTLAAVVEKAGERIGRVAWSMVSILDPELVVIGGPASSLLGPPFEKAISEVLKASSPPNKSLPRVEISSLGANAGPVGAATLVYQGLYAPSPGRLSLA